MNELQAMAIAALEASKDEAELASLRAAVKRESKMNTPRIGVLHVEVQVAYYAELLREAEYRHARISAAIEWVKAVPQFDHITTHKAAELRHRGYKDVGVVLQDDLGSTAVVAHGKVTWTEPVSVTSTIAQQSQFVPWTDKDVRELHAVLEQYPPATTSLMTAQPTATPCGQVTTTQTGQHTCTTMRVGDSKICPDCNPKRNFLGWLGEQKSKQLSPLPTPKIDFCRVKGFTATQMQEYAVQEVRIAMQSQAQQTEPLEPDYYVSEQHGELKASYTDESNPSYKWVPVIALSKVQS